MDPPRRGAWRPATGPHPNLKIALIEPLLRFVAEPIEGYEDVPGAGGKSTGDAAFSISQLPAEVQRRAIPAICDQLDQARSFDTMPLVETLLSAAFARGRSRWLN
jgi:hypothetical protein